MLTAGHCICSKIKDQPDSGALCKDNGEDQIVKGKNTIQVLGGSRDATKLKKPGSLRWRIVSAYVMKGPRDTFKGSHDIGMAITSDSTPFFNHDQLKDTTRNFLYYAKVVPICLAAKDTNIDKENMRGVGWGRRYSETPEPTEINPTRNPIYSSCMTNEVGEEEWKFKGCDLEMIKNSDWYCYQIGQVKTPKYPSNYPESQYDKCRQYFTDARKNLNKDDQDRMDKVDKIYVTNANEKENHEKVCYRHEYFNHMGWCKVQGPNPDAWGFCSPSCKHDIMKVGALEYCR